MLIFRLPSSEQSRASSRDSAWYTAAKAARDPCISGCICASMSGCAPSSHDCRPKMRRAWLSNNCTQELAEAVEVNADLLHIAAAIRLRCRPLARAGRARGIRARTGMASNGAAATIVVEVERRARGGRGLHGLYGRRRLRHGRCVAAVQPVQDLLLLFAGSRGRSRPSATMASTTVVRHPRCRHAGCADTLRRQCFEGGNASRGCQTDVASYSSAYEHVERVLVVLAFVLVLGLGATATIY